jgi:hypothetical protein
MHRSPAVTSRRASLCAGLAIAALAPAVAAQDALDTVLKTDGSSLRGVQVSTFTLTSVKVMRGKDEVDVPPHLVADVKWGGVPDAFAGGLAALQRGDFQEAQKLFGDAANAADRPLVKAEARLLQGRAAVTGGGADAGAAANAAGALRAWLTEFPDHWRVPEAMFLLGKGLRLGGIPADAEAALKDLDARATRDGWNPVWVARARFELALALLDQNKPLDARGAFQSAGSAAETALGTSGGGSPELKALKVNARVGEGETLVREKDYKRAGDFFRTLSQNEDPSLAASGHAGQGEALYLAAADGKDPAQLRRAQIALAEACVVDTGAGEASAKACYYLGLVMRALGERDGPQWKTRSDSYFQIVSRSYAGTRWAAAAKVELGK